MKVLKVTESVWLISYKEIPILNKQKNIIGNNSDITK